ncbi:hypothetical protein CYMTET_23619, partial [Cymbomonas tetramitiformis]
VVSPIGLLHLSGNEAGTYGGGVALFDNSVFHAANGSEFKANRAGTAGGHLHAAASSVVWMEQSVLDGGLITSGHGGALSIEESILELAHSRLMNSAAYHGGGILLRSRSNASLEYVLVRGNSALSRGGGLRVESGSAVRINHSEISFNHALDMGAGMEVAANAEGFVENSSFVGNEVEKGSGGGVSLASGMASITLLNVSFEEGSTPRGHGAGVYVAAPPAPAILETRLVALRFVNNSAVAGPNIYWEFVADRDEQAELDCQQCTVAPLQSELYASSAASFVLLQAGEVVLPEGLESISARPITPPIKYAGLDFYGNVAQEPGMDDVAVFSLDATLSGTLTVPYQQTGAEFNRLSVTGRPGASYTLVFQPWQDSWSSVTLKVALQPCQAGDVYIETAQTCSTCEAGSIKFDNSTDECTSCKNSGLTCHGGDAFTLEDGYFMAELSIHAACAERSAECVLARTSECDWSPACSSTANRNNMGGALAVPLEAQCGEGYQQGTTVLCGSCEAGYQLSMATGRCRECPTSVAERVGAASVVPLFVIMLAGVYLLVRQKAPAGIGSPPLDPSESEERDSVATAAMHAAGRRLDRAQNFGRILANNVQVMMQHAEIFQEEVFPNIFLQFLRGMLLNLDVSMVQWLALQCIVAGVSSGPTVREALGFGVFYLDLILSMLLPCFILLPIVVYTAPMLFAHAKRYLGRLAPGLVGQWGCSESPSSDRRIGGILSDDKLNEILWRVNSLTEGVSHFPTAEDAEDNLGMEIEGMEGDSPVQGGGAVEGMEGDSPVQGGRAVEGMGGKTPRGGAVEGTGEDCPVQGGAVEGMEEDCPGAGPCGGHGGDSPGAGGGAVERMEGDSPVQGGGAVEGQAWSKEGSLKVENTWDFPAMEVMASVEVPHSPHLISYTQNMLAADDGQKLVVEPAMESGSIDQANALSQRWRGEGFRLMSRQKSSKLRRSDTDALWRYRHGILKKDAFLSTYCAFATFMLVLVHPTVSTRCFQLFFCDELYYGSTAADYFVHVDRGAQCYTLEWTIFMVMVCITIALYVLGMPLGLIFITNRFHSRKHVQLGQHSLYTHVSNIHVVLTPHSMCIPSDSMTQAPADDVTYTIAHPRTGERVEVSPVFLPGAEHGDGVETFESLLENPTTLIFLGPYIAPYKRRYFYWSGCDVLFRLMMSSMIIIVRMLDPEYDLIYASMITVMIMLVHAGVCPFRSASVNFMQAMSYICQFLLIQGCIAESYLSRGSSYKSSVTGIFMVMVYSVFLLVVSYGISTELWSYFWTEHGARFRCVGRRLANCTKYRMQQHRK